MKRLASALVLVAALAAPAAAETPLERGAYLVRGIAGCGNCHTRQTPDGPVPGMELAGGNPIKLKMFDAFAPNITPDPETGIGGWTDDEIITAIREGRRPDGTIIGPPMPVEMYAGISDDDVRAIVAYLRSVPPVKNKTPKSVYRIPLPKSYGPPVKSVAAVDPKDAVAWGGYLAGPVGHCVECHTPLVRGHRDYDNAFGVGGFEIPGPWGVSVSANLTPHAVDGIARYSDADLKRIIATGVRPDRTRLLPPMGFAYYRTIRDADLDAIVAYLKTLPPRPSP